MYACTAAGSSARDPLRAEVEKPSEIQGLRGAERDREEPRVGRAFRHQILLMALKRSIGTGKMIVEFFSVAISVNVCR